MRKYIVVSLLLLAGCSAIGELTPSLKYCDEVDYKRSGTQIDIKAKCQAPVG